MKMYVPGIAALLMLPGCTNRQLYDTMQGARDHECRQIADAQKRERCFDAAHQSYDEYERRRSESRNHHSGKA